MSACNSLVRFFCTPYSGGRLLSTEDKEILVWAYTMRSQAHFAYGRVAEAIADLNDAVALTPYDAMALNNRCRTRAVANIEINMAVADCDASLQASPGLAQALDSRAFARLRSGEFELALADYDAALSAEPRQSTSLYGRGVARARLGQAEEAQADFAAAAALDENIALWFAELGLAP